MTAPSSPADAPASVEPSGESSGPHPSPVIAGRSVRVRALLGRWAIPLGGLLAALAVTIRTHSFFMWPFPAPVSNDEGYLAGMALRMVRGHWLPYVDGVSQRGPLLYWITTAVMRIGGLWSWIPMRVEGLVLAILISCLVFALTATLYSPMAGAIASMVLCYFVNYELQPWDGVGVNGEPVAVVFALAAALLVAWTQLHDPPKRNRYIFWAGVLVACSGLSKQMFLVHGVPIGLWLLLGRAHGPLAPWRTRWREFGLLLGGFAIPYVIVVGIYAATGHFTTFLYYYQRYGRDIFMDPLTRDYIRDKIREQIDRYYIGMAGVAAVYFTAIARALRDTMRVKLAEPEREGLPGLSLPMSPEAHVAINALFPGLGLLLTPSLRIVGALVAVATPCIIGARAAIRHTHDIPYTALGMARDAGIWTTAAVVSAVITGVLLRSRDRSLAWNGFARLRESAGPWYAVAQMAAAFFGACFTFRFFPHYFVEFFPFAAIVFGGVAALSFEKLDADDRAGLAAAFTLIIGGAFLLAVSNSAVFRNVRLRRETDRWYQDPLADPIVRYVSDRTTPDQSIFVWGFRAEAYLSAHRWPGSRYVYTVYPAGVVPWFQATHEEEERRVVPGSREQLLDDLEREQPELVVDAGRSMNGRYMYNYPMLRTYLDRKYCFMRYVDGEPVYRRRHGERCPPADY